MMTIEEKIHKLPTDKTTPAMAFLAKIQKQESVMTDIVSAVISKYNKAIAKRQDIFSNTESIWDYDESKLKKFSNDETVTEEVKCRALSQSEIVDSRSVNTISAARKTSEVNNYQNDTSEEIIFHVKNDKFHRIPLAMRKTQSESNSGPHTRVHKRSFGTSNEDGYEHIISPNSEGSQQMPSLPLDYSISKQIPLENGDSGSAHFKKMNKNLDSSKVNGANMIFSRSGVKQEKSFEDWQRERLRSIKGVSVNRSEAPVKKSILPKVKRDLSEREIDYFYGVFSDEVEDMEETCEILKVYDWYECSDQPLTSKQPANSIPKLYPILDIIKNLDEYEEMDKNKNCSSQISTSMSNFFNRSFRSSRIWEEAMISLKVIDHNDKVEGKLQFVYSEISLLRKSCPHIFEVLPAVGTSIDLPYSASALMIYLRHIFKAFGDPLSNWETAIEVYALAKKYKAQNLMDSCKSYFENNIVNTEDFFQVVQVSGHFGVREALKNTKTLSNHLSLQGCIQDKQLHYVSRVSCNIIYETSKLRIPLLDSNLEKRLGNMKKSDMTNEITIEALSGNYEINSLKIKLQTTADANKNLTLYYDVKKNKEKILDLEKDFKLDSQLKLEFHKIMLKEKETIKISVCIEDLSPFCCSCVESEVLETDTVNGNLKIKLTSDKKTESKLMLFYISQVVYTAKD